MKTIMNYLYFLQQQVWLYLAALVVTSVSYYVSLSCGFRSPTELSFYQFISFSLAFVLVGSLFRFLMQHDQ